ncbi:MAG: YIP1 family protein [Burkholderiales bacterium]
MECAKCGKPLEPDARFCASCGTVVGLAPSQSPGSGFTPNPPPIPTPTPGDPRVAGIVARITGIVLRPTSEWPVIAGEATTASAIYTGYVAPLAAIGVIALFLGQVLIGTSVPLLGTVRTGLLSGLGSAIVMYVMAFVGVWVLSFIVDYLAPQFGGQRDPLRALKVVAYSYTPAWVAGVLHLVPSLGVLVLLASLYGLYLMYLGLPVLMRSAPEKSVAYTAVVVVCAILVFFVLGALSMCVGGMGGMM